jgi:tetratricopeptide (TPR) repeat protein
MLYLILPPIIVIATLAVLVYFFSRRFPRVENEIIKHLNDYPRVHALHTRVFDAMKRASLYVLERLAQWFKVMTLKIYNALHHWTQSIREKKAKVLAKPVISIPVEMPEQVSVASSESEAHNRRIRPMISRRVTQPEKKIKPLIVVAATPVIKNQLEDILVERIAANPRDLEAYERLGEYYMEQGNVQDAKECYRQVLRLSPVHRLAKVKIRRLEKMLEQKPK